MKGISSEADATMFSIGCQATALTAPACPVKARAFLSRSMMSGVGSGWDEGSLCWRVRSEDFMEDLLMIADDGVEPLVFVAIEVGVGV